MKNWKTTAVGALIGGLVAIQPLLAGDAIDFTQLVIGFAIAAFGVVSKDFDKTGV